jgi:hypothetical protein
MLVAFLALEVGLVPGGGEGRKGPPKGKGLVENDCHHLFAMELDRQLTHAGLAKMGRVAIVRSGMVYKSGSSRVVKVV